MAEPVKRHFLKKMQGFIPQMNKLPNDDAKNR